MSNEEAVIFLNKHKNFLPKEKYDILYKRLLECDENITELVYAINFKNPKKYLILSICFGILGVDRFLIGDISFGFLKLFTFGGLGLFAIFDWFYIVKRAKKLNFVNLVSVCFYKEHNFC